MRTNPRVIGPTLCVFVLVLAGCSSARPDFRPAPTLPTGATGVVSPDTAPPSVELSRLMAHIDTLVSDEFEGRLPLEPGGRLAGQYIAEQFAACGLEPWADEAGYAQRFGAGINMVAVLRGSDPALADEFVVLNAHYDHLGIHDGQMFPGAADNAAGVAVMLEAARVLAGSAQRPARSVVFAAFDAEEQGLLGSYIFTARADFDAERFAGLVNLDMLGRATFDVRDNTLIAIGTRRYPDLRAAVRAAGADAGIEVLPIGRELVGPRSDHVAFEPIGRPWVFLTCGPFEDYHTPRDTADQLDASAVERSAAVVLDTVAWLADAPGIETPTEPTTGDREELDAVIELTAGLPGVLPTQFAPAVTAIRQQAEAMRDAPSYGLEQNAQMHQMLNLAMTPIIYGRLLSFEEMSWAMQARKFYVEQTTRYVEQRRTSVVEEYGDPEAVHLRVSPSHPHTHGE